MTLVAEPIDVADPRAERFEALFAAHHPAINAYALRRAEPELAADAVADTFLVAWRRLEDIPEPPLPWLYGVARRALADQRRSASRRDALSARAAFQRPVPSPDLADRLGEQDAIRTAFGTLSDDDRETLALVAWEGLDPADAALAAGCSRTTFNVRLFRARRRLATALAKEATS